MKHNWLYFDPAVDDESQYECVNCGDVAKHPNTSECYADSDRTDVEAEPGSDRRRDAASSAEAEGNKRQAQSSSEAVNRPAHYTGGAVECIDAIEAAVAGLSGDRAFLVGQVIKYVWRWNKKGGVEDLKKGKWYLKRLIVKESNED